MQAFLRLSPPREMRIDKPARRPVLLYTDASHVPNRPEGEFIVGAVLDDPRLTELQYTFWVVPPQVVAGWIPKKSQMGQLEIFVGPVALDTWSDHLAEQEVIHFVDNDSVVACLVKGYSPKVDSVALVGDYWLR